MPQTSPLDAAKAQVMAYNEKDWDAVRKVLEPDCVYDEVATRRTMKGHEEILSGWQGWATAFPDSKGTFESAVASGDTVTLELTWRGTHQGSLRGPDGDVASTGRSIDVRACQVVKVSDGRVRSIRHYFDMATLLQQLGR